MIKCLIIDDEPLARKLIKNHLEHFKQFEIVCECENAIEAALALQDNQIDLAFLDIQLPEINGIDFLKSLTRKPKVIITSAYKQFAIDGFDLDVLDFLLKPITLDRFFKAINKYLDSNLKRVSSIAQNNPVNDVLVDDILIKDNNKTFRINPNDILYIEGMREYIKIFTSNETIVTKTSLTRFYNQLSKDSFIRVHKSFIVNFKKVKSFTSTSLDISETKIPIGRSYKIAALEVLNA